MIISLLNQGKPCSEEKLSSLISRIGNQLPDDYVAFLALHDGCRLEPNRIDVRGLGGISIAEFLSADSVIRTKELLGTRMKSGTWPVAADGSGNYVGLSYADKRWTTVLWDHETNREHLISKSFDQFLARIDPDSDPVELAPGQVISAWVHPSLPKLQKK